MMPVDQQLIQHAGWQNALYVLAALMLIVMLPMAWKLREPPREVDTGPQQSTMEAVREAFAHKPFLLLLSRVLCVRLSIGIYWYEYASLLERQRYR